MFSEMPFGLTAAQVQAWAAIVTTLLTLVLAVATLEYVILTKRVADSAHDTSMQGQLPVLVLREPSAHPVAEQGDLFLLNVGSGPALSIRLSSNATFKEGTTDGELTGFDPEKPLEPWPVGTLNLRPVPTVIGPGGAYAHLLLSASQRSQRVRTVTGDADARFTISYTDVFGRSVETRISECKVEFVPPSKPKGAKGRGK